MHIKIEPSGCCERKGLVQVRLCFYLGPTDTRYDEHVVTVPERELTDKELANPALAAKVPTVQRSNPFHNHFIYVNPLTTDAEILDIAEEFAKGAYATWAESAPIAIKNKTIVFPKVADQAACNARVDLLKATELTRTVIK